MEQSLNMEEKKVGSVNSGAYNCYSTFTVLAIKKNLAKETLMKTANSIGSRICGDVLKHIENVIQSQLSHTLKTIHISTETYENIQQRFRFVVVDIFRYIPDWIIRLIENLINLFVTVFNPVDVNSERWRSAVATEIFLKLLDKKQEITNHISEEINNLCWKTKQDLQFIDRKLNEFTENVFPKDKKQLIMEWSRRDVIQDKTVLKKHPSIMQYIAGHSGDGKPVVKVFLSDIQDKDAQLCFENACRDLENTKLEFVNLAEKSKEIRRQAEKIKRCEKKLQL